MDTCRGVAADLAVAQTTPRLPRGRGPDAWIRDRHHDGRVLARGHGAPQAASVSRRRPVGHRLRIQSGRARADQSGGARTPRGLAAAQPDLRRPVGELQRERDRHEWRRTRAARRPSRHGTVLRCVCRAADRRPDVQRRRGSDQWSGRRGDQRTLLGAPVQPRSRRHRPRAFDRWPAVSDCRCHVLDVYGHDHGCLAARAADAVAAPGTRSPVRERHRPDAPGRDDRRGRAGSGRSSARSREGVSEDRCRLVGRTAPVEAIPHRRGPERSRARLCGRRVAVADGDRQHRRADARANSPALARAGASRGPRRLARARGGHGSPRGPRPRRRRRPDGHRSRLLADVRHDLDAFADPPNQRADDGLARAGVCARDEPGGWRRVQPCPGPCGDSARCHSDAGGPGPGRDRRTPSRPEAARDLPGGVERAARRVGDAADAELLQPDPHRNRVRRFRRDDVSRRRAMGRGSRAGRRAPDTAPREARTVAPRL